MKKMCKVSVLALFALTVVLSGCAQSAGGSTPRPPTPPSGPTGPESPPPMTLLRLQLLYPLQKPATNL